MTSIIETMKRTRLIWPFVFAWVTLATVDARVFDTEQQYIRQYGANVNKGVPAPPPYKFALYYKKTLRVLVLFENQVSQGELISKPKSRLLDGDIPGILAANQGSSFWKKEQVETPKDPKAPQASMWSRADGKLFAAYVSSGPLPFLLIGTRSGGEFLIKQKNNLTAFVKE
jgi:hypothetical protein